jgi:hypothetical protein
MTRECMIIIRVYIFGATEPSETSEKVTGPSQSWQIWTPEGSENPLRLWEVWESAGGFGLLIPVPSVESQSESALSAVCAVYEMAGLWDAGRNGVQVGIDCFESDVT